MTATNPACQCLVNPGWNPPHVKVEWGDPPFFMPAPPSMPKPHLGLSIEEQAVLASLVGAWNSYLALGGYTEDDLKEFRDSIHRCQQLVALRVARRADPDIWRQPEKN